MKGAELWKRQPKTVPLQWYFRAKMFSGSTGNSLSNLNRHTSAENRLGYRTYGRLLTMLSSKGRLQTSANLVQTAALGRIMRCPKNQGIVTKSLHKVAYLR